MPDAQNDGGRPLDAFRNQPLRVLPLPDRQRPHPFALADGVCQPVEIVFAEFLLRNKMIENGIGQIVEPHP